MLGLTMNEILLEKRKKKPDAAKLKELAALRGALWNERYCAYMGDGDASQCCVEKYTPMIRAKIDNVRAK